MVSFFFARRSRRLPLRTRVGHFQLGPAAARGVRAVEDGAVVDAAALIEKGIIKKEYDGVKVLGNGNLTKKLTVKAAAFSSSASQKIEAAGGKAEVL